jgi:hypothetical protein
MRRAILALILVAVAAGPLTGCGDTPKQVPYINGVPVMGSPGGGGGMAK